MNAARPGPKDCLGWNKDISRGLGPSSGSSSLWADLQFVERRDPGLATYQVYAEDASSPSLTDLPLSLHGGGTSRMPFSTAHRMGPSSGPG